MREQAGDIAGTPKEYMNTNGSVYPRWEREGRVSRFFVGPSLSVYQVEEIELTGINVRRICVGQSGFSWPIRIRENAKEACARDFAET